jgi:hypothetical protein
MLCAGVWVLHDLHCFTNNSCFASATLNLASKWSMLSDWPMRFRRNTWHSVFSLTLDSGLVGVVGVAGVVGVVVVVGVVGVVGVVVVVNLYGLCAKCGRRFAPFLKTTTSLQHGHVYTCALSAFWGVTYTLLHLASLMARSRGILIN